MFKRQSGKPNLQYFPKKASTAFANGDMVYADGSGAIQPADATSGNHFGIMLKDIVSGDADYAATTLVPVDIVGPDEIFVVDVGNGSATSALIGTYIDLHDAGSADVEASSKDVLLVVGVISASKIVVKVNASAGVKNVETT